MKKIKKIKEKINFKCQGSSNCCVSRNSYGYVYLDKNDTKKLSNYVKLSIKKFLKIYCDETDGFTHFKENNKNGKCQFLSKKKCTIYNARPTQCRTWPFWDENMNAKTWNEEISKFCPGIGKGKIYSAKKIKEIIKEDKDNENRMLKEIN
tara:strand:+ start:66 stop:515 length:450 start_codon:yes stop_codon:yes gene_type:complete